MSKALSKQSILKYQALKQRNAQGDDAIDLTLEVAGFLLTHHMEFVISFGAVPPRRRLGSLNDHSFRESLYCADMRSFSDSLNDMPFRELAHRAEAAESRNLLNGQSFRESSYWVNMTASPSSLNDLSFRESRGLVLSIRCFPRSFGRNCYVVKISKTGQPCGKGGSGGELPYSDAWYSAG